ncbi:hypothetical protein FH972_021052 [Carpinus fangiana]|uniref:Uncharacterized protein n=1 Tax=Carpinus fangiana TaxID=176857 RepID=A0A5N6KNK9_9ROSI|nr:hypothetical protein FH972_021052 [Carpinus fangiana]
MPGTPAVCMQMPPAIYQARRSAPGVQDFNTAQLREIRAAGAPGVTGQCWFSFSIALATWTGGWPHHPASAFRAAAALFSSRPVPSPRDANTILALWYVLATTSSIICPTMSPCWYWYSVRGTGSARLGDFLQPA